MAATFGGNPCRLIGKCLALLKIDRLEALVEADPATLTFSCDLYRNTIQQKLEDAKAEYLCQMNQRSDAKPKDYHGTHDGTSKESWFVVRFF